MTANDDELKASVFQRLHPRIYLERFLAENVRPDARDPAAFRDIGVNVGKLLSFSSQRWLEPDGTHKAR